jgi:hypothetical protein
MMRGRGLLNVLRVAMIAAGLLAIAGCTQWPKEGTGGMGEFQPIENERAAELDYKIQRLAALGGDRYAASDMVEARTMLIRVRRALLGGLQEDAEQDMDRIDVTIRVIQKRLGTSRRRR